MNHTKLLFGALYISMLFACVPATDATPEPDPAGTGTAEPGDSTSFVGDEHQASGWEEDPVGPGMTEKAARCESRWQPSPEAISVASSQYVPYAGARSCSGGATSGARALGDYIRDHFGAQMNLDIPGRGVQIYNCRSVRGGSTASLHGEGRAVDIFFETKGGSADNQAADPVANWLIANSEHIGVQMLIWDRTIWTSSRSPQARCYTGSHPHYDHIHVELTRDAAARRTPFFAALNNGTQSDPAVAELAPWIGTACNSDLDCDFVESGKRGRCFPDGRDATGVCTIPCEGYCPDRGGYAPTFCAVKEDIGGRGQDGACVSRSDSGNRHCDDVEGSEEVLATRRVGNTGASRIDRTVCAPVGVIHPAALPEPEPELEPEPAPEPRRAPETIEPDDTSAGACGDVALPTSEHDDSCADSPAEHWRCACSPSLGTTVSQVCRNGRWLTYDTNPADCSSCDGSYGPGCEKEAEGNGGVCTDESLPLSDNSQSCSGVPAETWRCACSDRFEVAISQVCRDGSWLTYDTNPRDCNRCDGGYSSGCEAR